MPGGEVEIVRAAQKPSNKASNTNKIAAANRVLKIIRVCPLRKARRTPGPERSRDAGMIERSASGPVQQECALRSTRVGR